MTWSSLLRKVARGLSGRRGLLGRVEAWASRNRDPTRPLLWLHASSVGEGLQAQPVLERLRRAHPDWQLAYSFFSPSAARFAEGLPVDFADYLPLDLAGGGRVNAALDALAPQAVVFTAADVWPGVALAAAKRGTPLGLIAAALAPGSGRLRWPVRDVLRPAYAALQRVGAVDPEHARRLTRLGCRAAVVTVTGDTRYDSAAERAAAFDRTTGLGARLRSEDGVTLVAGSTWPPDEDVVLKAFAAVRPRATARVRLILAPHEPTAKHLAQVGARAARLGLPAAVPLGEANADTPFVVVDRVGVLAELYGAADVAYVGGGYHRAGLHSVLEPAVFGIPVVVGPRWTRSRDAGLLLERGGAVALPEGSGGSMDFAARWLAWMVDPEGRRKAGAAAKAVVEAGLGAADRTVKLIEELVIHPG